MKILVTGATGFLGQHVVRKLVEHGYDVIAIARHEKPAKQFDWYSQVKFISYDIHQMEPSLKYWGNPKTVMHLAWSGLPNYQKLHHLEKNLPAQMRFLRSLLEQGAKQLLVTGTCLEFGRQNGPLSTQMLTIPENSYAIAKDTLRKWLQCYQAEKDFILQWVRLFYMYGPGQNPNSVLSQLDRAIENGDNVFNMSGGEQLRDYLPIEEVSRQLVNIVGFPNVQGIIHCCSGKPISIKRLVENHIAKRNASIELNLGYYPYPDHEPMAFWGNHENTSAVIRV